MSNTRHWDEIYSNKLSDKVGWYTPHLITPLNWIEGLNLDPDEAIIDVGGGASTLVDDLLEKGHKNITILYRSYPPYPLNLDNRSGRA